MINIVKITPTLAKIIADESTLEKIRKELTYTNKSIEFLLSKHKKKRWLINKDPIRYNQELELLKSQLKSSILFEKDGNHFIRPGSISHLIDSGFVIDKIETEYKIPTPKPIPWSKPLPFELYYYQKESCEKLIKETHGNVSITTGAGKTAIILKIARELGNRVVIVTPARSIFRGILKDCIYHFGKNKVGAFGDGKKEIGKQITVCVAKSLTTIKKDTSIYEFFNKADVVCFDESHVLGAETLEDVCHGIMSLVPYRFFFSGTQTRGDGSIKLLESIIGKCVHTLDFKEAVAGGFICPIKVSVIKTFTPNPRKIEDKLKAKRVHILRNPQICKTIAKTANLLWTHKKEQSLILVEEISQIADLIKLLDVPFGYVHGNSISPEERLEYGLENTDTDKVIESFDMGKIKVLIGTSCVSMGTNIFAMKNTFNWQCNGSEVKTKQGPIGRSVRLLHKSKYKDLHTPKNFVRIFDFLVENDEDMKRQFFNRLAFYKECTDDISYIQDLK